MTLSHQEMLLRLGSGEPIDQVCAAAGMKREHFTGWWQDQCRRRVPRSDGESTIDGLVKRVRITRDTRGMAHVIADNDGDLFVGFGYATAQDRLFQLDYVRRKARGRLAEILGAEAVDSDMLYRTLDLAGIARAEWESLRPEIRDLLTAYSTGVNALMEGSRRNLPIEFDLLGYEPEPWSPLDCLVIVGEFRWYLTGRFPVIVVPELVKRAVGEGPLYQVFLGAEAGDECIVPKSYIRGNADRPAESAAGGESGPGSNNWVLSGSRMETHRPLVASDPHVPFAAVSLWHEIHLRGGSFHAGGAALAGMPGILLGRSEWMAWGVTNNICSQRDLYQEQTNEAHPGCFLDDGQWRRGTQREELIQVRGAAPLRHTVRSSHNGPIVDQLLPPSARSTGPVSLRWLGAEPCGWVTAVLDMNRARSVEEFRSALRPWRVPTFNLVFADAAGSIAYQCSGRIPLRGVPERGYRPGHDRRHRWDGLIPEDGMPADIDPSRGFLVTANNRVVPDDYAYPLSGTWITGYRARRIRESLEARPRMSRDDQRQLQLDVHSGRAAACLPALLKTLASDPDHRVRQAVRHLKTWDLHVRASSVAAAIFNVFFVHWCRAVAAERLPREAVELVASLAGPLSVRLLHEDPHGWFS
jgi:penicillin amidase